MAYNYKITIDADTSKLEGQIKKALDKIDDPKIKNLDVDTQNLIKDFQAALKKMQDELKNLKVDKIKLQEIDTAPLSRLKKQLEAINSDIESLNNKKVASDIFSGVFNELDTFSTKLETVIDLKEQLLGTGKSTKAIGSIKNLTPQELANKSVIKQYQDMETAVNKAASGIQRSYSNIDLSTLSSQAQEVEKNFNESQKALEKYTNYINKFKTEEGDFNVKSANAVSLATGAFNMTKALNDGRELVGIYDALLKKAQSAGSDENFIDNISKKLEDARASLSSLISLSDNLFSPAIEAKFPKIMDLQSEDVSMLRGKKESGGKINIPIDITIDSSNIMQKVEAVIAEVRNRFADENTMTIPSIEVEKINVTTAFNAAKDYISNGIKAISEGNITLPEIDKTSFENFISLIQKATTFSEELKSSYASLNKVINRTEKKITPKPKPETTKSEDIPKKETLINGLASDAESAGTELDQIDNKVRQISLDANQFADILNKVFANLKLDNIGTYVEAIALTLNNFFKQINVGSTEGASSIQNIITAVNGLTTALQELNNATPANALNKSWKDIEKQFGDLTSNGKLPTAKELKNSKTKELMDSFSRSYLQYQKEGGTNTFDDLKFASGKGLTSRDKKRLSDVVDKTSLQEQANQLSLLDNNMQKVSLDAEQLKSALSDIVKDLRLEGLGENVSSIATALADVLTKVEAGGASAITTIQDVTAAIKDLSEQMMTLTNSASGEQLDNLWEGIQKQFSSLTSEGKIPDLRNVGSKKAMKQITDLYNQYKKSGGKNYLEDLKYANGKQVSKADQKKLYNAVDTAAIQAAAQQEKTLSRISNDVLRMSDVLKQGLSGSSGSASELLEILNNINTVMQNISESGAMMGTVFSEMSDSLRKDMLDSLKREAQRQTKEEQGIKDFGKYPLSTQVKAPEGGFKAGDAVQYSTVVREGVARILSDATNGQIENYLKDLETDFQMVQKSQRVAYDAKNGAKEYFSRPYWEVRGKTTNDITGNPVEFSGRMDTSGFISLDLKETILDVQNYTDALKSLEQEENNVSKLQKQVDVSLSSLSSKSLKLEDMHVSGKTEAYYEDLDSLEGRISSVRSELGEMRSEGFINTDNIKEAKTRFEELKNEIISIMSEASRLRSGDYNLVNGKAGLLPNTQDVKDLEAFTKSDQFLQGGTLKLDTLKMTKAGDDIVAIKGQIEAADGSLITFTNHWDSFGQGVRSAQEVVKAESIAAKQAIKDQQEAQKILEKNRQAAQKALEKEQQQAQKAFEKDQTAASKKVDKASEFFESGKFTSMSTASRKTSDYYERMQQLQQQYDSAYAKYQTLQGKDVKLFDETDIQTAAQLEQEISKINQQMNELSGNKFNLDSNPAAKQMTNVFKTLDKIDQMSKVGEKTDKYYSNLSDLKAQAESIQSQIFPLQKSDLSDQERVLLDGYVESLKNINIEIDKLGRNTAFDKINNLGTLIKDTKGVDDLKKFTEDYVQARGKLIGDLKETSTGKVSGKMQLPTGEVVQFTTALDGANQGVRILTTNIGSSQSGLQRMGQAFGSIAQGMLRFAGLQRVMMAAFRQLREGFQFAQQMDQSLTTISMTMDVTQNDLRGLGSSALDMAQDLSTTVDSVTSVAEIYANMNESVESILEKTRPTLMLSNASGLDVSTASDIIQGVTQQYTNLEGQEQHVVDSLETVSASMKMNFGSGIQAMSQAIEKSGSVAQEAGLSYEKLIALAGKVTEITRQSGDMTGNALKTIFARIGRVNDPDEEALSASEVSKIATAYKSVGISVYDANGNFQDIDITLSALADKWDTLTDAQRSYIAEQSAGRKVA